MSRHHDLLAEDNRTPQQRDGAAILAALLRGVAPVFGLATLTVFFLLPVFLLNDLDATVWRLIVALCQLSLLLSTLIRLLGSLAALAPGPKDGLPVENRWSIFPNNVDHAAFAALVGIALGFLR
jgi:hypothetical protein